MMFMRGPLFAITVLMLASAAQPKSLGDFFKRKASLPQHVEQMRLAKERTLAIKEAFKKASQTAHAAATKKTTEQIAAATAHVNEVMAKAASHPTKANIAEAHHVITVHQKHMETAYEAHRAAKEKAGNGTGMGYDVHVGAGKAAGAHIEKLKDHRDTLRGLSTAASAKRK